MKNTEGDLLVPFRVRVKPETKIRFEQLAALQTDKKDYAPLARNALEAFVDAEEKRLKLPPITQEEIDRCLKLNTPARKLNRKAERSLKTGPAADKVVSESSVPTTTREPAGGKS